MAASDEDIDDILDQALDDLEKIDTPPKDAEDHTLASPSAPSMGLAAMGSEDLVRAATHCKKEDGVEEEGDAMLDEFMKQMQSALQLEEGKNAKRSEGQQTKAKSSKKVSRDRQATSDGTTDPGDVSAALASILEQMTTMDPDEFDGDFGAGDLNPDSIVEGMMEHLLSKDIMYEPMKHVADQFPAWLEEKKDSLSEADLAKYHRQHECFKKLVKQYETDPSNTERLMTLMQDAQEFGQPPEEIVKAIAPGLELDDEGMPKINPLESFGEIGDCPQM